MALYDGQDWSIGVICPEPLLAIVMVWFCGQVRGAKVMFMLFVDASNTEPVGGL